MKARLHLIPFFLFMFTLGILCAVLSPVWIGDAEAQAPQPMGTVPPGVQAPYEVKGVKGSWELPSGYTYGAIEAWVPAGQTHGMPYVLGAPTGTIGEGGLFMASEVGGDISFGGYVPAPTLRNYEMGNDPDPASFLNDLKRMPDGSPLVIGGSSSPRTLTNGYESTVWEVNSTHTELVPKALGFLNNSSSGLSVLVGGNSQDGYAGGNSTFPAYVPPTGGGVALPFPPQITGGIALDLDGSTIVGESSFRAFFFNKATDGTWIQGNLQLPDWSDGTGSVTDVAGKLMGGYLYSPNIDDVIPVLWNTDGSIHKVFDLPGYNVTELIEDGGSIVALLNQGEGVNVFGESRLYAEGWTDSRLVYGDILPALTDGTTGTVRDISDGGGMWFLTRFEDAAGVRYGIADVISSVPEPNFAAFFLTVWVLVRHRYHNRHRI